MSAFPELDDNTIKKVEVLWRLLFSNRAGEADNAGQILLRTLKTNGVELIDAVFAYVRFAKQREIDMQAILNEGIKEGIEIGKKQAQAQGINGRGAPQLPDDRAMAAYCYQRIDRVRKDEEKKFINNAMRRALREGSVTDRMRPWLEDLYVRLGGKIST